MRSMSCLLDHDRDCLLIASCVLPHESSFIAQASEQAAVKEKEELRTDLERFRGELKLVREDRDLQLSNAQSMAADLAMYKDCTGKSSAELASLVTRNETLEVGLFFSRLDDPGMYAAPLTLGVNS